MMKVTVFATTVGFFLESQMDERRTATLRAGAVE
jgi:hypothetical protein